MTLLKRRKPFYWLLIDFIATLLLLAGMFKIVNLDLPFISDLLVTFSARLLLTIGGIMMFVSMLMFLLPAIKANREKQRVSTVERTKR